MGTVPVCRPLVRLLLIPQYCGIFAGALCFLVELFILLAVTIARAGPPVTLRSVSTPRWHARSTSLPAAMATSIPAYTLSWVSLRVPHVTRSWSQSSSLSCLVPACLPRMLVDLSHASAWALVYRAGMVGLSQRPAVIAARSGVPRASGPWPAPRPSRCGRWLGSGPATPPAPRGTRSGARRCRQFSLGL